MNTNHQIFTDGNIFKSLFLFSGPIILTNLLQTSFQFIDSIWIGNLLGSESLAAVTLSTTLLMALMAFILGLNNAVLTILSQQYGRQDYRGFKTYLNTFIIVIFIMAIIISTLGFIFSKELLLLLDTPISILNESVVYLKISFVGVLFMFGYNFLNTVSRALGDSKSPMRAILLALIINLIATPVFIYSFNLGIEGAAYSTVLAHGSAFLYSLFYNIKNKLIPFTLSILPSKDEIILTLRISIPSGLQLSVVQMGNFAILSIVTGFGTNVISGFSATQRLDSLMMLPAMAIGTAVNSMAGQNIGTMNWDRVHRIARVAAIYNFILMTTLSIILVCFAKLGIRLFIQNEESIMFGSEYLKIVGFCYPFFGLNFVFNGVVRASGTMYKVLILNIISFWVLRYPLIKFFSVNFGEGGIGIGMGVSFIISSCFSYAYYKFGKWKNTDLFTKDLSSYKS